MGWLGWITMGMGIAATSMMIVAMPVSSSATTTMSHGVLFWRRWLPVVATIFYLVILAANLSYGTNSIKSLLNLGMTFSYPEILVLFLVGPVFFTPVGPTIATATTIYLMGRFFAFGSGPEATHPAVHALLGGAVTIIAVMGSHAPWMPSSTNRQGSALGLFVFMVIGLAAICVSFATLLQANAFKVWLFSATGVRVPVEVLLIGLGFVFIGWLLTTTDIARRIFLIVLAPPTLLATAFLTHWTVDLLAIPFAAALAIALLDSTVTSRHRGWHIH